MAIDTQPVLVESFAAGASGTSIPAAVTPGYQSLGTADGMLFDAVTIGSGQSMTYDNTQAYSGTQSCKIVTTSTNTCFGMWDSAGLLTNAATQQWFRVFLYMTGNPGSLHQILAMLVSGTRAADVIINTNGTLSMRDAAGTVQVTTTNTVNLNSWFRLEGYITSSASSGQVELKLFNSPASATPTETQTSGSSLNTTGGAMNQVRFGLATGGAASLTWWMANPAVSISAYIGAGAVVQQMITGGPTSAGFTVISKPVGGTSLRLKVATNSGLTSNVTYVAAQSPRTSTGT